MLKVNIINILVFSPEPSHPHFQGNQKRMFTLAKYMQSLGHSIHFVYFNQSGIEKKNFELMLETWDTFTLIEMDHPIEYKKGNYALDAWYQEHVQTVVTQIIKDFNVQMILMLYYMQSKLLEALPSNILKVIDAQDRFTDRYKLFEDKNTPEYFWYSVSREDEIKGLNRADIILSIQKEETAYFSSIVNKPVMTINHLEKKCFLNRKYTTLKKIGFVGSSNEVNVHAINTFLQLFLDSELSKNIQIILAGNICSTIELTSPSIVKRGIIPDLKSFYEEVDLIINPLLFGTGLKIKSVEALSYGVPIVSTKIGFEGISSSERYHQLDTMDEMILSIHEIYRFPEKLEYLSRLSRTQFEAYEQLTERTIEDIFNKEKLANLKDHSAEKSIQGITKIAQKLYRQVQYDALIQRELREKANTLMQSHEPLIEESEKEVTFTIRPNAERAGRVKVAFYLFRDDEAIDIQWYSENYTYRLDKNKYGKGKYRIQYFLIDKNEENPGKAKKLGIAYSDYVQIA